MERQGSQMRLGFFEVTGELILALVKEKTDLLNGTSLVRAEMKPTDVVAHNSSSNVVRLIVTSGNLSIVEEGAVIPRMDIVANK